MLQKYNVLLLVFDDVLDDIWHVSDMQLMIFVKNDKIQKFMVN
jgi:hypothetical protein